MDRDFWKGRKCDKEVYHHKEDETLIVFWVGLIVYDIGRNENTDILEIAHNVLDGSINFNKLHGFYKIVIYEKISNKYFFWGDNAGSQRFFIDKYRQTFSDSMLSIRKNRGNDIKPCFSAIASLLSEQGAFTGETILEGVYFTEAEKYYSFESGKIEVMEKKLLTLSENKGKTLKDIMEMLLKAIGNRQIAAVCTGGTDSRVVLAYLNYMSRKPLLILTGRDGNPDIPIAQEIANKLGLSLTVYNPDDKEQNWLEKAYFFSDGIYDPIESYRHLRKMQWASENNLLYEFGGVGGEFCKHYFLRFPDWLKKGNVNVSYIMKKIFFPFYQCPSWAGASLQSGYKDLRRKTRKIISKQIESDKFRTMNRVGLRLLQGEYSLIANNLSFACVKIDPFMDRDVVAEICTHSQRELYLYKWHRKQIKSYCPQLCSIPTDKGYSFSANMISLFQDVSKRGYRLVCILAKDCIKLVSNKIGNREQDRLEEDGLWSKDSKDIVYLESFEDAIKSCKRIGIISEKTKINDISLSNYGTLYMVGRMFGDYAE